MFTFVLGLLFTAASALALESGQVVRIVNRSKTLSVQNSSLDANKPIEMWTETGTNSQRWTVLDTGRGTLQFVNVYTGYYLGIASTASKGSPMVQITKAQSATRGSWELVPVEGKENTYVLYMGTSRRLALSADATETDGAPATLQIPADSVMSQMEWTVEVVEAQPNHLTEAIRDDMMEKWKAHYYHKADVGYVIGKGGWWGDAEMFEVVLDALETTGDPQYATMFDNLYQNFCKRNGTDWNGNEYNDDIAWMCIACIRAYLLTGKVEYRTRAKSNFDKMYARANAYGDGTLVWKQGNTGTNSCINGPAAVCACYLGIALNQKSYYDKAIYIYSGHRSKLFNINSSGVFNGHVYDSYSTEENKVSNTWASTYNQGTSLGAAVMLYNYTGNVQYKNDADAIMSWTAANHANSYGIVKVCQTVTGDLTGFKGILMRYVRRYAADLGHPEYYDWLAKNAYHAWNNRNSKGISMSAWLHKTTEDFNYSDGGSFATDGVGAFTALSAAFNAHLGVVDRHNAYTRIEAENFNFLRGTPVEEGDDEDGTRIAKKMKNLQYIGYRNVDFGSRFASDIRIRVNLLRQSASFKIYADDPTKGMLLATIDTSDVQTTGSWAEAVVPLERPISGVHDIYVVASGISGTALASFNWFGFESHSAIYPDITNNGGKTSSSFVASSASLHALTDGNPTTDFMATKSDGQECWVQYVSPSPVKLQGYTLFSSIEKSQDPVSWTLQGSNDATIWVDLDKQDSVLFAVRGQMKQYNVNTSGAYTAYRLLVRERSAEETFAISEWQLLGQNLSSTDITADGGTPLVGCESLFDHDAETVQSLSLPAEASFTCNGDYILTGYSVTAASSSKAPVSWTLYASTNGRTWNTIDTQIAQSFPYDGSTAVFPLSDVAPYDFYRISFEGEEGTEIDVAEVQLLGSFDFGAFYPDVASISHVSASDGSDIKSLVDKDGKTFATLSGSDMKWSFDFPVPTKIIAYSMVSADDTTMYPTDVNVTGVMEDGTSASVSTRTFSFDMPGDRQTYSVSSSKLFVHADFNVLGVSGGGNAVSLADLEIYGTSIAPVGSDLLPEVEEVAASREGVTTTDGVANLYDHSKVSMYRPAFTGPVSVTYKYATPQCIDTYAITASKSDVERDPKSWVLEASDDGNVWQMIDERKGENFSSRYATQFYSIAQKKDYSYYRLTFTENGGEPQMQIGEIQFLQMANLTPIQNVKQEVSGAYLKVYGGVVEATVNVPAHLSVYDLQGRLLISQPVASGITQVPVEHIPAGTYVASLQIEGKRQMLKFLK